MKKIILVALTLIAAGCSVAPIQNYHSARSLGAGYNEIKLMAAAPGVSYDRGITSRFDLGAGIEFQTGLVANVRGKYALLNPKRGFAAALFGGAGYSDGIGKSKSVYGGPIFSYRWNSVELFLSGRVNHVNWKNDLNKDDRDDLLDFIPRKSNFNYGQVDAGFTFYGDSTFVTVGGRYFVFKSDSAFTPVLDLGFSF